MKRFTTANEVKKFLREQGFTGEVSVKGSKDIWSGAQRFGVTVKGRPRGVMMKTSIKIGGGRSGVTHESSPDNNQWADHITWVDGLLKDTNAVAHG
jgi:hypothetical protein